MADDHAGDRSIRISEEPLERGEVGRAGRRPIGDLGDLVGLEAGPGEVRPDRLPVVAVDPSRDEDPAEVDRLLGPDAYDSLVAAG